MRILLAMILCFVATASMAETKIAFLNGIDGNIEKSKASVEKLRTILDAHGYLQKLKAAGVKIGYVYNSGDGFFDDKTELREQALLSSSALTTTRNSVQNANAQDSTLYRDVLGSLYDGKIRDGSADSEEARHVYSVVRSVARFIDDEIKNKNNKLIIVAHSQGNFFAEAVNAYIRYGKSLAETKVYDDNLRFVGVASVAASTPNGVQRYISLREDNALDLHAASTAGFLNYSLLPRNVAVCDDFDAICKPKLEAQVDPTIHGFLEIYTSELVDKRSGTTMASILTKMIGDSFDELNATSGAPSLVVQFDEPSIAALGAETAGGVAYVAGRNGGTAAKFGGVDNPGHIRIPNGAALQFADGATFDLWVRIDSNVGMTGYKTAQANSGWAMALLAKSHDRIGVALNTSPAITASQAVAYGSVGVASYDQSWASSCAYPMGNTPGIAQGEWFRVTAVVSATTGYRIYVNSQLFANCADARPNFSVINTQDLYIGKYSDYWYPLNGAVQDLRIYKRALTPEEVQALN